MNECPQCGYKETQNNRQESHHMNNYVNKDNPKTEAIFNDHRSSFEITTVKGVKQTWIRKDVYLSGASEAKAVKVLPLAAEGAAQSQPQTLVSPVKDIPAGALKLGE